MHNCLPSNGLGAASSIPSVVRGACEQPSALTTLAAGHLIGLELTIVPSIYFITAEKGGVARAKGVGEKEKKCTTEVLRRFRT